jgi:hypothetical protein
MATYLIVDPPSGWMYGFPKAVLDEASYEKDPEGWFLQNGYPKELIAEGMLNHVRFWREEKE